LACPPGISYDLVPPKYNGLLQLLDLQTTPIEHTGDHRDAVSEPAIVTRDAWSAKYSQDKLVHIRSIITTPIFARDKMNEGLLSRLM
jgi:hypothetical protein